MAWKSSFRQNHRTTFSPTVPTSAAGISHVVADVEAPGGEKWKHLKSGGKQWQATSKNLPRMQRSRAISVAWLSSGLCPDRPKGWIPIIIIIIIVPLQCKEGMWEGHGSGSYHRDAASGFCGGPVCTGTRLAASISTVRVRTVPVIHLCIIVTIRSWHLTAYLSNPLKNTRGKRSRGEVLSWDVRQ